ncbi:MAG: hypothetical protein ACI8RD_008554, partial [Bacillariaceae sp.]
GIEYELHEKDAKLGKLHEQAIGNDKKLNDIVHQKTSSGNSEERSDLRFTTRTRRTKIK